MAKANRSIAIPKGNFAAAVEALSQSCGSYLYALDDFGRRFAGNPFSPLTMGHAIEALTARIRANLDKADAQIHGRRVHPAQVEIAAAREALDALDEFINTAVGDDELTVPEAIVGTVILDLTIKAGKCIERAELACGAEMTTTNYMEDDQIDPNRVPPEQKAAHG